jgi:hypothetical protein
MNKYSEVKIRPPYSYKVQKLANALPNWATARKDKHSNYQAVMSDLIDPITELVNYTKTFTIRMLALESDSFESDKLYTYFIENAPKQQYESFTRYKPPLFVTVNDENSLCDGYPLIECPSKYVEDLNNRLPLEIKSLTPKGPCIDVISYNPTTKETCIFVKEICYLGFHLSSEVELIPENFYMKENNTYAYSNVYLRNSFNLPLQGIDLLPYRTHNFPNPVHPGIYYISFQLIEAGQLDDYTVSICPNYSFPTADKNFYYDTYIDANIAKPVYLNLNGEYLEFIERNPRAHSELADSLGALESFTMLDELDTSITLDSYVKQDMLMYGLSNESGTKLYCYDLFLNGNSYVYEDNESYLYEIVLNQLDYKIDDEIVLESRETKLFSSKKIKSIRLKVENYESSSDPEYVPYYIDEFGNTLANEDLAWRDINTHQKKWKFIINTIGSYRFTIECLFSDGSIAIAGVKLMLVNYKVPYKVFNLGEDYSGWNLGISPDNKIELVSPDQSQRKVIQFYKDGYFFDDATGNIWTNYPFEALTVEYE